MFLSGRSWILFIIFRSEVKSSTSRSCRIVSSTGVVALFVAGNRSFLAGFARRSITAACQERIAATCCNTLGIQNRATQLPKRSVLAMKFYAILFGAIFVSLFIQTESFSSVPCTSPKDLTPSYRTLLRRDASGKRPCRSSPVSPVYG